MAAFNRPLTMDQQINIKSYEKQPKGCNISQEHQEKITILPGNAIVEEFRPYNIKPWRPRG